MRSWRTLVGLVALLLIGWGFDAALGGGRAHALGWIAALVLVAGPVALVTLAARRREATPTALQALRATLAEPEVVAIVPVRAARPADLDLFPEVEQRSDSVFTVLGIGPLPPVGSVEDHRDALAVFVVGEPPVGFARLDEVDGLAHLEQLSVIPRMMRQGHGTALVGAAVDWARERGYAAVTLCTFRDVPFNAPFYARLGFEVTDRLTPGLRALRAHERELGLDDLGARVVMRREL